jgi:hypothetical protein
VKQSAAWSVVMARPRTVGPGVTSCGVRAASCGWCRRQQRAESEERWDRECGDCSGMTRGAAMTGVFVGATARVPGQGDDPRRPCPLQDTESPSLILAN